LFILERDIDDFSRALSRLQAFFCVTSDARYLSNVCMVTCANHKASRADSGLILKLIFPVVSPPNGSAFSALKFSTDFNASVKPTGSSSSTVFAGAHLGATSKQTPEVKKEYNRSALP